jgi:hypothetical protein
VVHLVEAAEASLHDGGAPVPLNGVKPVSSAG